MKRSVAFILILLNSLISATFACGPFYPFGDDIRFTLLKPGTFNYPGFMEFSYSADLLYTPEFNNDIAQYKDSIDKNIEFWRKRCRNIPGDYDTYRAIYILGNEINNPASSNTFIQYLHKNKDIEAINYLNFAKKCSPFNSIINDPWEREEYANVPQRTQLITQALKLAQKTNDEDLGLRYAFLAIRLAYYNNDFTSIQKIYEQYFSNRKSKNIIDYWSMYFMALTEKDHAKRNYYASQVFFFAPDKRGNIFFYYDKNIPITETLKFAEHNEEKTAVWMLEGFRRTGKNMEVLRNIYTLRPNLEGLSFLLLREVNKLEDWIFTPYYTNFRPSIESWDYEEKSYPENRIRQDREYAKALLKFVSSVSNKTVENPVLWKMAKVYLHYMVGEYDASLVEITAVKKENNKNRVISRQLDILKAICLTASQTEKAIIPDEVKPILMREYAASNNKLIFAVARELEYKGNTTDAAVLLSKFKSGMDLYDEAGYWRNGIYWRSNSKRRNFYVDYYDDYFFYLDAQYSTEQLKDLIADIQNNKSKDVFSEWKYAVIKKDVSRLYDLMGTKFLRVNNLKAALHNFGKVSDTLWTSAYYPYQTYLDANPFYTNMYNEHSKTTADTVRYNKYTLTLTLINYLNKAEDTRNPDRDYYYFLAANCYLNMTQYGNSWMMRRYFWTSNFHKNNLEDDDEFYNCKLARQYYLKANEVSNSRKFAALCLRMAGRCEKYRIINSSDGNESQISKVENIYYKKLKEKYFVYYNDLMSNCESFDSYFNARNISGSRDSQKDKAKLKETL